MRCERSSFWTKHHKTNSEQLYHHSNQSISCPNSAWSRSHLIESNPNPFSIHLDWVDSNPVQIQSKSNPLAFTVHTGGLASPKSSRNPIRDLWTHLKCRNNRLKWRDAAEFFKPACLYLEIRGWTLSDVWTCFSNPSVSVWEKIEVKVCKVWLQSSSDV